MSTLWAVGVGARDGISAHEGGVREFKRRGTSARETRPVRTESRLYACYARFAYEPVRRTLFAEYLRARDA